MKFTPTEQHRGEWTAWGMRIVIGILIIGLATFASGCTAMLIDKDTMGLLKEVVASGTVDAEDPEIIVEFGHSYFMRVALQNTDISAEVSGKTADEE